VCYQSSKITSAPTEQLKKQLIMWQLANWGQTTKEKAIAYVANTLSAK